MSEAIVRQNKEKEPSWWGGRVSLFHIDALCQTVASLLHFGLHFGLDTPKSMTLGYIANLCTNK